MSFQPDQGEALPVFLDQSERAVSERAALRFAAFLERELEEWPASHPNAMRLRDQRDRLRQLVPARPRTAG